MLTNKITSACHKHGHPEIELEFDSDFALETDVAFFSKYLADEVAKGTKYEPGQIIQIGWMMNRIDTNGQKLTLAEPDLAAFPIQFVRGVTNTFRHLRLQKSVAESVGLEAQLSFPSILESGIVCSQLADRADFVMDRSEPKERDSGWFLGCADPAHDHNNPQNLSRQSLYEIVLSKPECILFLALPAGSWILSYGGTIEIRLKDEILPFKKNSFLDQFLRKSRKQK